MFSNAGLAIYNSHILEFQFPLVLYKKLMGQPLSLPDDLAELHPEIHASLGKLAAMSDDELAGMGLTFQVGDTDTKLQTSGSCSLPAAKLHAAWYLLAVSLTLRVCGQQLL